MLVKLGSIIGTASGSLRSDTFSHNRFGVYVRNRSIPVNPNTSRQSTVRTAMQILTNLWGSTLTAAQRAQWSAYAAQVPVLNRLGDTVLLTGLNHYVRSNVPRLVAGLARVDAGPVIMSLPETDESVTAAYTSDDQKMSVAYDDTMVMYDTDGAALLCYAGTPVDPSINFFGGPFRFGDSIDGDSVSPPTSPTEINSPFTIQTAQQVYSRFRITLADGRLSNFFRSQSAIVAAS